MKSADEVLQSLLENSKTPLADQFLRWRLTKDWESIVGPQIAARSAPVGYRRRTLYVWVESSAWIQQLCFFTKTIKDKVNDTVGKNWVSYVRFTLDKKIPEHNVKEF